MTGFRARARAVDMLGRQQIANLPTALSELFKNAHDAYATIAIADYYRKLNMLVVRDDGVGMDLDTFQGSWLTIATESKLDRSPVAKPRGVRPRVQLGEKGIGRFAIGALGSQVLVISKHADSPTIAAFVNWQMFELPGIDLDEVPVGLIELAADELTEADVERLKKPLCEAVERFGKKVSSKLCPPNRCGSKARNSAQHKTISTGVYGSCLDLSTRFRMRPHWLRASPSVRSRIAASEGT